MAQDQQVSPGDAHESSTAAGTSDADEKHSVLDDLGAEVTGIAFPVSICMVLTIALVRILHKQDDAGGSVIIAEAAYGEKVLPPLLLVKARHSTCSSPLPQAMHCSSQEMVQ